MKCPICNNEIKKGIVEVRNAGSFTNSLTMVNWYSDKEQNKNFGRKGVNLRLNAEGYYCDECMKVFAAFDEK